MEGSDNIMSIFNSITPIKYSYSKSNRELNRIFKNVSLENIKKNLNVRHKVKDVFSPSSEFLKNKNKFEINFKNSYSYIQELSNINNLPLLANNKIYIKKCSTNDDFVLNTKVVKKKIKEEMDKRNKDIFIKKLKKVKSYKIFEPETDSLRYNPNYDFIKKKIYSVHISPPPSIINIKKNNNNENKENEKNNDQKNKNLNEQGNIKLIKNKKDNIFDNSKINSVVFQESYTNRSNSIKNQNIDSSNSNVINQYSSRNNMKLKDNLVNLKNLVNKNYEYKNSLTNSDCCSMEINKSTNIENISFIFYDLKKFYKSNSLRNKSNKNIILPKITNLIKKNPLKNRIKRNNEIKNSIYFEKMLGRKDINKVENSNNSISYSPNYEFFRPHIQSNIFSYKQSDKEYKKYKIGKIIRGFNCSPDNYFVFEFKKKESKKYNLNRERLKIFGILKKKSNFIY